MITTRFNIFISCLVALAIVVIFLLRGSPSVPAPPLGMERIPDSEIAAIHSIMEQLQPVGAASNKSASVCLRGLLTVVDNLTDELQVGVFQAGVQYATQIRLTATESVDDGAAAAAITLKVYDVNGDFVGNADAGSGAQDFFFTNRPSLPFSDVADVAAAMASDRIQFDPENILSMRRRGAGSVGGSSIFEPGNRWWSAVPYRFGRDRAIKYGLRSCPNIAPMASNATSAEFNTDVSQRIARSPACLELMVQFQADPQDMRIEDATSEWDEVFAPFEPLALVQIPVQAFDSNAASDQCGQTSFAPWQSLVEHQPLGGINRLARALQERDARL